jgi:nitroimidazol reductase NimA-like FMN-containing flavoprotein (pyridoxamine 5'-phosphate oxidase superfamily)
MTRAAASPAVSSDVVDGASLRVIPTEECWGLLATQQVGRLAVVAGHYPLVVPVNYGLDGQTLVLRLSEGTKRDASAHANVAFEVDLIDVVRRTGWSVLVRGLAEELTDRHWSELVDRTHAAGVEPWAPGEHGHWFRLLPHRVSGRRIVPRELPPPFEDAAYL